MMMMMCRYSFTVSVLVLALLHDNVDAFTTVLSTNHQTIPVPVFFESPTHLYDELSKNPRSFSVTLYKSRNQDSDSKPISVFTNMVQSLQSIVSQRSLLHRTISSIGMALLVFFSVFTWPSSSYAAQSGGRIGGGSFRQSSDRQRYSSTRMIPSSSRSYSRSSLWNDDRRNAIRPPSSSSTTILINPFSYSWNPFFPPRSPVIYGGVGSAGAVIATQPSLVEILVLGGIVYFMVQGLFPKGSNNTINDDDSIQSVLGNGISVSKITIAMQVSNRQDPNSILHVLDQLAYTANTDSRVGLQGMIHQVALELLRKRQSIVASFTLYKHFNNISQAQKEYNTWSIDERSKFERETVSKFNGRDYSTLSTPTIPSTSNLGSSRATYAVVTIVLAISGDTTILPKIRSVVDIETALNRIAVDAQVEDCVQSTELLWTPTDPNEVITKKELLADYPDLIFV